MGMTTAEATTIIDDALLTSSGNTPLPDTTKQPVPFPVPVDNTKEVPLTPEEKKAKTEQEKIDKAQDDLLGKEEAEALREEERKRLEREKTLLGLADKALQSTKSKASSAGTTIGNIPTPGNITFPLLLLLLFFFILIVYNGHSRFQWVWLVLTGNASVNTSEQGSSTGGGPSVQAQEHLIGEISLPAFTSNGMVGSPFS